jgi:serine/threonine-protein kinase
MKHCTICGKEFPDDVDTCDSCGYRFDSIAIIGETEPLSDKTTVFSSGSIIGGRYRVKKLIGQGGMGSVFLVHDTMLRDQKKALKVIHPRLVKNPEALQRFIDEVIICQKLNHPNIIRVFHLDRIDNFHFFTMEFLAGISLREWFNRLKDKKPPFSLTETLSIIHPLLDALSYAQHFMIRPDIKTETI